MGFDDYLIQPSYFWPRTSVYIVVTTFNLVICILYFIYARKYTHIKTKDPVNLFLIFISGHCQSWAHFLYSLPIYNETNASVTLCITVGYVFQHLFGTALLFYCLFTRLIKYGAIYHAFEKCCKCMDYELHESVWTKDNYRKRIRRKYNRIMIISSLLLLLPMLVFILSSYSTGAVSVDNDTDLCSTDSTWKLVFVTFNILYFVSLSFMLCFIPRYIKTQQFNEGLQLRDSIVYATVIFCIEVWIGFRENDDVVYWYTVSNMLMFSIPTFIIARVFWHRLYKAIRGDVHYESTFRQAINTAHEPVARYSEIVLNMSLKNKMTTGFIDYCSKFYSSKKMMLTSTTLQVQADVSISDIIEFIQAFLILKAKRDVVNEVPESRDDITVLDNNYNTALDIFRNYLENNTIPTDKDDVEVVEKLDDRTKIYGILNRSAMASLSKLYQEYYTHFSTSIECCRIIEEERVKEETLATTQDLFNVTDDDLDLVELEPIDSGTRNAR